MDMKQLRRYLTNLSNNLETKNHKFLCARLGSLKSVFPFNEYEYILMFLLDKKIITFQQYEKLREKYVSSNPYLELYSIAPRVFGEIWGHPHIMDIDNRFKKPSKELDSDYKGQYDLWFDGVRVEVKSCRAINTKKRGNLIEKALGYASDEPFWMNYQQIKPDMADVFIFVGVWVDKIIYWIMSREEIKKNKYLSSQHRGGIEYQIGITHKNISEFDIYKVGPRKIGKTVLEKGEKK
ncbi:MAG: hypothetical protein BWX89_00626 [candidate division TA06 bacterium ADurb.Bin131]|uniref:Uncharacterized protein n=1 Tax=candidate division TA06 bacterium ADurb.Bin131 TaxID=1852827 RepID=A0A1V6CB99_UNCT6|nr:MAG: hypothetical protein BWX89_00626 [candidate division TA06 bacterium ADurb.Bin131]